MQQQPSSSTTLSSISQLTCQAAAVIHAHLPPPDVERCLITSAKEDESEPAIPNARCDLGSCELHSTSPDVADAQSAALLVLPWDFRTSFPRPLKLSIEAGKIDVSDAESENLKSLHEEHARHALSILSDLDTLGDARRRGVDPVTGRPPRSPKQKERLEKLFAEAPQRLEVDYQAHMDVYEEVFGEKAAKAFGKAIGAQHAGVEVISEQPPALAPLPQAVQAGVFGQEEDGRIVRPSHEEIFEITSELAENLDSLADDTAGRALLAKYEEDFGPIAAHELDRWVRLKSQTEQSAVAEYDPGHPWHYYGEGDHAAPLPVGDIGAQCISLEQFGVKWPRDPRRRFNLMRQLLDSQQRQLLEDIKRYGELVDGGVDALSQYDKQIAHGGDQDLAWATAISLKYNHIRGARGRIQCLQKALGIDSTGKKSK